MADAPDFSSVVTTIAAAVEATGRRRLLVSNVVLYLGRAATRQLAWHAQAAPPGQRYGTFLTLIRQQIPPDVWARLAR